MQKDTNRYRGALHLAVEHGLTFLEELDQMKVGTTVPKSELRRRLFRELLEDGIDPTTVLEDLIRDCEGGILGNRSGRFFGWVIGGVLPAAQAADLLTSFWDQNAALHSTGPAVAVIEEVCGIWLKDVLGLPMASSFALVTGCQMAHFTCLAAARNQLLNEFGWDVEEKGLFGAPPIRVLSGEHRHGSVQRAFRYLGLGTSSVVESPTDELGRLDEAAFERALHENKGSPMIVVLQAGDINLGAFDRFTSIIKMAHEHSAWVHVDGAFGLWACASKEYRHLTEGVSDADSWATDGHKWLNVPYDSGYAFVRNTRAHSSAMSYRASYLSHDEDFRDQIDWNPEWSRRSRGVSTYAALRELGRKGLSDLIERTCRHAKSLTYGIGGLEGAEVVWPHSEDAVLLNQGLVRFLDPKPGASEKEHALRTDSIIEKIQALGEAFFTPTDWKGKRCMRISVCNWETSDEDVQRSIDTARRALELA